MSRTQNKKNIHQLHAPTPLAAKLINLKNHQDSLKWRRSNWAQTTDFTCGPSCLLMAAQLLGVQRQFRQIDEYLIWRRANTLFMGEGHAGCSPEGLGLAGVRLGLRVKVYQKDVMELLGEETASRAHSGRKQREQRRIMEDVILDDRRHFLQNNGEMVLAMPTPAAMQAHLDVGDVLMCLVNEYDVDGSSVLHWVLAVGAGGNEIAVLNPWNQDNIDFARIERLDLDKFMASLVHGDEAHGAVMVFSL